MKSEIIIWHCPASIHLWHMIQFNLGCKMAQWKHECLDVSFWSFSFFIPRAVSMSWISWVVISFALSTFCDHFHPHRGHQMVQEKNKQMKLFGFGCFSATDFFFLLGWVYFLLLRSYLIIFKYSVLCDFVKKNSTLTLKDTSCLFCLSCFSWIVDFFCFCCLLHSPRLRPGLHSAPGPDYILDCSWRCVML